MKGILFKPAMIEAIRKGRKTVTRRLHNLGEINKEPDKWFYLEGSSLVESERFTFFNEGDYSKSSSTIVIKSHFKVGEIVYIKEAHSFVDYQLSGEWQGYVKVEYPLDGITQWLKKPPNYNLIVLSKRSPMFMPAWVARYFIKILGSRPERLQEISQNDIISEGCPEFPHLFNIDTLNEARFTWYRVLCDAINPKQKWNTNPFVWVYSFIKVDKLVKIEEVKNNGIV